MLMIFQYDILLIVNIKLIKWVIKKKYLQDCINLIVDFVVLFLQSYGYTFVTKGCMKYGFR